MTPFGVEILTLVVLPWLIWLWLSACCHGFGGRFPANQWVLVLMTSITKLIYNVYNGACFRLALGVDGVAVPVAIMGAPTIMIERLLCTHESVAAVQAMQNIYTRGHFCEPGELGNTGMK